MSEKIVLIVFGLILLILGILMIVAGLHSDWESKELQKVLKTSPTAAHLKLVSLISGGVMTAIGLGLLAWGVHLHKMEGGGSYRMRM
jgi:hypothetical protein